MIIIKEDEVIADKMIEHIENLKLNFNILATYCLKMQLYEAIICKVKNQLKMAWE